MAPRVTIVGAGWSGLTLAHLLLSRGLEVEIYEAAPRSGGLLQSDFLPGFGLGEAAANAVLASDEIEKIAREIGLSLLSPLPSARKRYIFSRGQARRWPLTFFESLGLVWRFFTRPRRPRREESIATWGERVLGRPAVEKLLAPALQGIYAGRVEELSATLILGRFFSGPKKRRRKMQSLSPERGMHGFIKALESSVLSRGGKIFFNQSLTDSRRPQVVATSAPAALPFIRAVDAAAAALLESSLEMLPVLSITAFFPPDARDLKGFGCLFPRAEGIEALGVLFNSDIFPGRSEGLRSETWIYRGPVDRSDAQLLAQLQSDRRRLQGTPSPSPRAFKIWRWSEALPHYTVPLEKALATGFRARLEKAGLYLVGNYLGQIGLTRIVDDLVATADRLEKDLKV